MGLAFMAASVHTSPIGSHLQHGNEPTQSMRMTGRLHLGRTACNGRRTAEAGVVCTLHATSDDAIALIGLRVITGAALAWVYPTGMRVAAGWFEARVALGVRIVADG